LPFDGKLVVLAAQDRASGAAGHSEDSRSLL